jgi:hypothetical protein
MKGHGFERTMEGDTWRQDALTEGETERSVRNLGTASISIFENGDDESRTTDIAKGAIDNSIDIAVFRVQALKSKSI